MAEYDDTPAKKDLYRRYCLLVGRAAGLSVPPIERIDVQYRTGHLSGWLCLAGSVPKLRWQNGKFN